MSFPTTVSLQGTEVYKTYTGREGLALGTVGRDQYGRKFRWCLNGAASLAAGKLVQAEVPGANFDELAITAAVAVGAKTITVTNGATAITANMFRDGWLNVEDDTGEGVAYPILSHPAADPAATCEITLAVGVSVALGASATVGLTKSKCAAVIIHPSPPTAGLVGVPLLAVAAGAYFWAQFAGPCSVLTDGALLIGKAVMASDAIDGAVEVYTTAGDDEVAVGQCLEVAADTEYSLVDLLIP